MIFGEHQENTIDQFRDISSRADRSALMADGHFGYVMPVGGVAAYRNKVSVSGVGFDIACGNMAVKTTQNMDDDPHDFEALADEIADTVSFGIGRNNRADDAPTNHDLFDDPAWQGIPESHREQLRDKARDQLGTVGGGNHYVDVFHDEEGWLWVGVHFGSRGFGHTVASNFLAYAAGEPWGTRVKEEEALLHYQHPIGHDYIELMKLAGQYAYAGREWVVGKVLQLMSAEAVDTIHNHHNFAWRENHYGQNYWVVRKGATPAFPGQRGFVGGSMGDKSVILRGSEGLEGEWEHKQAKSLFSTVHGAGRVMGRIEAKGKWKRGRQVREGKVSYEDWQEAIKGVIVRGGYMDEAPQVYRKLDDVLTAQGPTITVEHTLTPIVVVMAPSDTRDPYKD